MNAGINRVDADRNFAPARERGAQNGGVVADSDIDAGAGRETKIAADDFKLAAHRSFARAQSRVCLCGGGGETARDGVQHAVDEFIRAVVAIQARDFDRL